MPDRDGRLDQSDHDKVLAWLNDKAVNHDCPVCLENDWTIGDDLVLLTPWSSTGAGYPMVFLVCNRCAHVRQFMAWRMGLVDG